MVRKILRCLPKKKWGLKVIATEEVQDLKRLELDYLLGKLLTHEIHLKEDEGESSRKGIALEASKEDCTSDEEETNDDEAFSLIGQGLNKMGLKKRFNQRGSNQRGPMFRRNDKMSKGKFINKDNSHTNSCYGCSMANHLLKDYPLLQKIGKNRKFKTKKDNKKAMADAWSDSESSESESHEEHTANICLMAKEVQNNKETEYENSNEVDASKLYKYSKEELIDTSISFANIEQKYLFKYKDPKKTVLELKQKNLDMKKLNNDLHNRNKTPEEKNLELQVKCDDNQRIILKFTQGQENLDKLCTQKASFNKERIGYKHFNKNKCYKSFFVKPPSYKKNNETCN